MRNESGQVLVEFATSLALATAVLVGAGRIFYLEWTKTQCVILVFEKTHAELAHTPFAIAHFRDRIDFHESKQFLQGNATCGSVQETIRLPKLETLARSR